MTLTQCDIWQAEKFRLYKHVLSRFLLLDGGGYGSSKFYIYFFVFYKAFILFKKIMLIVFTDLFLFSATINGTDFPIKIGYVSGLRLTVCYYAIAKSLSKYWCLFHLMSRQLCRWIVLIQCRVRNNVLIVFLTDRFLFPFTFSISFYVYCFFFMWEIWWFLNLLFQSSSFLWKFLLSFSLNLFFSSSFCWFSVPDILTTAPFFLYCTVHYFCESMFLILFELPLLINILKF